MLDKLRHANPAHDASAAIAAFRHAAAAATAANGKYAAL